MKRAQGLSILAALAVATALCFGQACATAAQKRRDTVAQAVNTYQAAMTVYEAGCRVAPHTRGDCAAFYVELGAAYQAIKAAAPAVGTGRAPVQLEAVQASEKALRARIGG